MSDFWVEQIVALMVASMSGWVMVGMAWVANGLMAVCWVERMIFWVSICWDGTIDAMIIGLGAGRMAWRMAARTAASMAVDCIH